MLALRRLQRYLSTAASFFLKKEKFAFEKRGSVANLIAARVYDSNLQMAEAGTARAGNSSQLKYRIPKKSQPINKLYSFPAPIHIFPLPTFVPHNPVSLLYLICTWAIQTIRPPSSHPEILFEGLFSAETHSVDVTDPKAIRGLWEQGFYGKGNLSRSEPSWLEREKKRRGVVSSKTSEDVTKSRRVERQKMKWERARKKQEAIEMKLLEEGHVNHRPGDFSEEKTVRIEEQYLAPIGPRELLALPNSTDDLSSLKKASAECVLQICRDVNPLSNGAASENGPKEPSATCIPKESIKPPEIIAAENMVDKMSTKGSAKETLYPNISEAIDSSCHLSFETDTKQTKYQKSVRFSPDVDRKIPQELEHLSLDLAASDATGIDGASIIIPNREHLQLTMEEAFFLSYGLGVLRVLDPLTRETIAPRDLFYIFRKTSYFETSELDPVCSDDPFILSYVVYHHFRSLGWVVRGGAKFAANYLLYNRGPVFSHAEFAVIIFPSYSDPYWSSDESLRAYVTGKQNKTWSWLHCINRVNSQAKKTLILAYVDIPQPLPKPELDALGIDGILKQYKVREIVLQRWLANRVRD